MLKGCRAQNLMPGNARGKACAWSGLAWAAQICFCALLISSYHPERTAEDKPRKRITTGASSTAAEGHTQALKASVGCYMYMRLCYCMARCCTAAQSHKAVLSNYMQEA